MADWRDRLRITWIGLGQLTIGACIMHSAVANADRSAWSLPQFAFGGAILTQGFMHITMAWNIRPFVDPPPVANGSDRVEIPLEEQGDPEVPQEGLVLNQSVTLQARVDEERQVRLNPHLALYEGPNPNGLERGQLLRMEPEGGNVPEEQLPPLDGSLVNRRDIGPDPAAPVYEVQGPFVQLEDGSLVDKSVCPDSTVPLYDIRGPVVVEHPGHPEVWYVNLPAGFRQMVPEPRNDAAAVAEGRQHNIQRSQNEQGETVHQPEMLRTLTERAVDHPDEDNASADAAAVNGVDEAEAVYANGEQEDCESRMPSIEAECRYIDSDSSDSGSSDSVPSDSETNDL